VSKEAEEIYGFDSFRLYRVERALECKGEVKLSEQCYIILLILVRCRGRKVRSEELIGAVWPGQKKADRADNLYVDIAELRKALRGAAPEASEFIRNYRGEGYRFMADVDEHGVPVTVAILPLKSEGNQGVPDEVGQEMADTLTTMLNKNMSIRVVPSATVISEYNEHPKQSPLVFGHRLVADYVFSGCIKREHVQITCLDVRADRIIASTSFEDGLVKSFDLAKLIHKWMETVLKLTPTDQETEQSTKQYTKNQKANECYRKGRIQRFKGTGVSLRKAVTYFKRATEEDPDFARAYANLADTYIFMGMMNLITPQESYDGARDAAIKAREKDETMASAHTAWAFTKLFFEWQWEEAKEGFERAIEINPNYPVARMGHAHWLTAQGRHREAVKEIDEALALNPYSFFISFVRGMVYFLAREYGKSLKRFEWTHELNLRFSLKSDLSHYGLSLAHEYLALTDTSCERETAFKNADDEARLAVMVSNRHPLKLMHRAHVNAMWGKRDEALKLLDEVLELRQAGHYVSPYHLGTVYASLEEVDPAIESLEEAEKVLDQYLFLLGVDPRLDNLRSDQRFTELLLRLGLKG
jgi:tetratricopeptide (TPR) repeat protein